MCSLWQRASAPDQVDERENNFKLFFALSTFQERERESYVTRVRVSNFGLATFHERDAMHSISGQFIFTRPVGKQRHLGRTLSSNGRWSASGIRPRPLPLLWPPLDPDWQPKRVRVELIGICIRALRRALRRYHIASATSATSTQAMTASLIARALRSRSLIKSNDNLVASFSPLIFLLPLLSLSLSH